MTLMEGRRSGHRKQFHYLKQKALETVPSESLQLCEKISGHPLTLIHRSLDMCFVHPNLNARHAFGPEFGC